MVNPGESVLRRSLKQRTVDALLWSAADTGGRQAVQFAVSVMLARLLSPADFGLLAMLALFLALAQSLVDSGFGTALVQRKEITEGDKSTVFFFNVGAGAAMAAGVYAVAPLIAAFYRAPELSSLARFMALTLFIGAFGSVQSALLAKALDFRTLWKIGMIATSISGVIAVWMAVRGFGVWSLAAQAVSSSFITAVILWVLCQWKPTWTFDLTCLKRLFGYGSKLLAAGLINTVFDRLQLLLIGKLFSPTELGYYTRAFGTQQAPASIVSTIVAKVTFPVFATVFEDAPRLKRGAKHAVSSIMVITLPMMIGLAATAAPLVDVLFGHKWIPCVPYLRVLAIVGAIFPLHIVNLSLVSAAGRSDLFFRAEIIKKLIFITALIASLPVSVLATVWALLGANIVSYIVNVHYLCKVIPYGVLEQMRDCLPSLSASLGMAVIVLLINNLLATQAWMALALSVPIGSLSYCIICRLTKVRAFLELVQTIQTHTALNTDEVASCQIAI